MLRGCGALAPEAYWLEIAQDFSWDRAPDAVLEGKLGDFRYFPGAMGNVSANCLDRWPAERVALHYQREGGLTKTWIFGALTDAVARFAAVLEHQQEPEVQGPIAAWASSMGCCDTCTAPCTG